MKTFVFILSCFIVANLFAQYSKPDITFEKLLILAEENPQIQMDAIRLAISKGEPVGIYLKERIYIEAKGIENNNVVYSVITNPLKIYEGAYTSYINELKLKYNFSQALINYGNGRIVNPLNLKEFKQPFKPYDGNEVLVIVESQQRRVISFNPMNGDLISESFIPNQDTALLKTPKHLLQFSNKKFIISDQLVNVVQKYDTNKAYQGVFAPFGGLNLSILQNIRGMAFRKSNGNLLVANSQGGSPNSVREFDLNGNLIGDFVASGDSGLSSPYCILPRENDYILTASGGTYRIRRISSTGTFVNGIMTSAGTTFPQQLIELPNGNFAFTEFSVAGSGIKIITPNGTLVSNFTGVQGLRGIYQLGSGHYLITNSTGIFEVDDSTGGVVRTLLSGIGTVSGQFISKVTISQSGSTSSVIKFSNGWNLFSVPLLAPDMSVNNLFPGKSSSVYLYANSYQNVDSVKNGIGYWVKYPSDANVTVTGMNVTNKTTNVLAGWNIIGPYNNNVPVLQIQTNPPGNVGSMFYGFNPSMGYLQADTLKSGNGYFVKFNQNGTVTVP